MNNNDSHNGMSPGDIITTYFKGYYRLESIQRRYLTQDDLKYQAYKDKKAGDEYSPLFHFVQVADGTGKPKKSKALKTCDAAFCEPALLVIISQINSLEQQIERLRELGGQIEKGTI